MPTVLARGDKLGWGTRLALLLSRVGITKSRWAWLGRKFGWIGKDESCGCQDREKWLNSLGDRVARWLV